MATYPFSRGFVLSISRVVDRTSSSSSVCNVSPTGTQIKGRSSSIIRIKALNFYPSPFPRLAAISGGIVRRVGHVSCHSVSMVPPNTTQYEFLDGSSDVELRLSLRGMGVQSPIPNEIHVDADESSLVVSINQTGSIRTLMETNKLYDKIRPGETIWYLDDDQLVINLRKQDPDLKWPDIVESWESLSVGVVQLLKGASIYLVGDSSEINQKVAEELAVGLGYTPLDTKGLLETFAKQSVDSWVTVEGSESVAEAEGAVLESLSSHVRAVIATLGGEHGAAGRADKWRHLYAGFTVWLSKSEATDEDSAKEEAGKQVYDGSQAYSKADVVIKLSGVDDGSQAYSKADVVIKLSGWDAAHAKTVAQASLSALKQLILSDKQLPGKKSLYVRLGCRGDWPNIKPPGWDPSSGADLPPGTF